MKPSQALQYLHYIGTLFYMYINLVVYHVYEEVIRSPVVGGVKCSMASMSDFTLYKLFTPIHLD